MILEEVKATAKGRPRKPRQADLLEDYERDWENDVWPFDDPEFDVSRELCDPIPNDPVCPLATVG